MSQLEILFLLVIAAAIFTYFYVKITDRQQEKKNAHQTAK